MILPARDPLEIHRMSLLTNGSRAPTCAINVSDKQSASIILYAALSTRTSNARQTVDVGTLDKWVLQVVIDSHVALGIYCNFLGTTIRIGFQIGAPRASHP